MSTVNISFNPDLLKQIDKVAEQESRSRSELIREAARSYIERKRRWARVFELGNRTAKTKAITLKDLETEIASYRKESRR
jgi:CopG family transcriptional regulator/antitoxin EndoAI